MTDNPNGLDLAGYNLKEWSLILLIASVGFTIIVVGIGFAIAISNGEDISFTGSFDLSQYQAVIIGMAMVGITLVAQQLTNKNNAVAVAAAKK